MDTHTHTHKSAQTPLCEVRIRQVLARRIYEYIHTYIFIPQIQSPHQLHLNMKHVNKHQTTQHTWKKHLKDKRVQQQKNTFTGVNQSITPVHHAQWNNFMHKTYSNDI